ncbi:MAG: hypothetical protein PHE55_03145 [Methylococcaceae bacterium]|nr:hypothetical protein [Methylococcaceae bacterium]
MADQSYIGIDSTENNEWVVVLWTAGRIIFSRPFKNTPLELGALVHFITEQCTRPKICLKPANPAALKLIKFIGGIPDVEVVLMSDAGLRMQRACLPRAVATPLTLDNPCQAYLLAFCAERMI